MEVSVKLTQMTLMSAVVLGILALGAASSAQAFNFGNMMNPSRWFNGDDDYYDRRWRRYGPYGPYGWGGPYGGYGLGGPWGYPGYGGGTPSTIVVTPQSGSKNAPPPPKPE